MSGAKSAWEADFLPDVTRPENREVPQRSWNNCHQRQAQAAALRNLPLRSIPSLVPAFIPGLSDILSLAPALHAVPSRHPFTWPWAAMGFARAQPAPASLPPAPRAAPGRSSPTPCRPPCPWPLWGKLFQIVLGLMCPGGLSGGGKSQNEAKSRRFGMDMPCRAFYEGLIPKRFGTRIFGHSHQSQSAKNTPANCYFLKK